MKGKVSVVDRWNGVEYYRETYVYDVPLDTTVRSKHLKTIHRVNRMLAPGYRFRGDVGLI